MGFLNFHAQHLLLLLYYYHFTALWISSGTTQVSQYQKKNSPTHTYHGHQSSVICFIYYDSWHPPCSIYMPDNLFPQSLHVSLVYLLAWYPPLHTPYISSPNHCLLFAAHVHTIATCFAVVLKLCYIILVSLSPLLGTLILKYRENCLTSMW